MTYSADDSVTDRRLHIIHGASVSSVPCIIISYDKLAVGHVCTQAHKSNVL